MILDMCCGSKMFYFNKSDERVIFGDIRKEEHVLCDGRKLSINPDLLFDFRNLPFKNEQFNQVVFDPPHLERGGEKGWQVLKYGKLSKDWREDLYQGFNEAFRVLSENGSLIFKWNETQILLSEILKLTDKKPVLGHRTGKQAKTHWSLFVK